MAVSVRMDPLLEKELELAAKRSNVTKSQFIIDAVRRALGHKDPYKLYVELQEKYPQRDPRARSVGQNSSKGLKALLQTKHRRETVEWLAVQGKRGVKRKAA